MIKAFVLLRLVPALAVFVSLLSLAQVRKQSSGTPSRVGHTVQLAQSGHCKEAIPILKKEVPRILDKNLKRDAGLAGARCAMMNNQFDAAQEFLRVLNRDFPDDPEVLYVSVHTYSDLATHASQRLAKSAPNSAQAHELNAEALEMQGKWDEAAKEYEGVLQKDSHLPGIHFRIGRLLLSKPNPSPDVAEQAKKEFQQELEIDPNNAGAEYVLGELDRQAQQWDESIQHFSRAAKLDAGFGDAYLGWGLALIATKKFSEAVTPLEKAVKLEPQNPAAHYNLAMAYSRTGQKANADREFAIHRQMVQKNSTEGASPAPDSSRSPQ